MCVKTSKEIDFVLVRENGSYITPRTMQHVSRVIHNDLNVEDFDFRSLRHTHATILLEKGAPLKYIRQRLGHKKIVVTINVYQHLTEDMRKAVEGCSMIFLQTDEPAPFLKRRIV